MGVIADLVWQYNCVHVYTRTLNVNDHYVMLLNTFLTSLYSRVQKMKTGCACVTVKNKDH